jgi:Phosphotransferase enzyme family
VRGSPAISQRRELDRTHVRLIITRRGASEVLLARRLPGLSLPRLNVPSGFRLTDQLVAGVLEKYHLKTYCLFTETVQTSPDLTFSPRYAVMEVRFPCGNAPADTTWVPFTAAGSEATLSLADRAVIASSLEHLAESRKGPFAKPGWMEELLSWVREQIAPLGSHLTGDFRQLNASSSFSLVRIATTREAVWFKATGEPNAHELSLTLSLAQLFPTYVPRVIAVHSAWNGWLSQHVSGTPLGQVADCSPWERAAEALAELQICSIGKTPRLLAAGARDNRMGRLAERIDAFLSRMSELMAMQEKRSPAPLVESELRRLADVLEQSCTLLEGFGLPHTVGHLDFNPGNILVCGDRCVFLDWAEGAVANPLVTFEYLSEHLVRSGLTEPGSAERLVKRYLRPWACFYSPDELRQARKLSPLIAVFAYAVANDSWRSVDVTRNANLAAYFRSLTRRMYREAIRVTERSELCLS